MKLSALLEGVTVSGRHGADADVEISRLVYDARQVTPGALFCTWRGFKSDGHRFVADAVAQGAAALVVEKLPEPLPAVPTLTVGSGRHALSLMAANFYHHPARTLNITGLTGTNGKSSIGFLLHYLKEKSGQKCGLLGTVEYRAGVEKIAASRTTPESSDLQALFAQIRDAGCSSAVMEVSSHALELDRVFGVPFRAAVYTNLTRDHLDFHGTMENYFLAKQKLFASLSAGALAVVNLDDAHAARVLEAVPLAARAVTCGFSPSAMYRAENVQLSASGSVFDFVTPNGTLLVRSPWIGKYNVANTLAALTVMAAGGEASLEDLANWLPNAPFVPGRLQKVPAADGQPTVLVDYAHSDDAVRNVLQAMRPLCKGKLKILLGCGGDRDRTKRPLMALAACELADEAVFTADNPRSENPEIILRDMKVGVGGFENYRVIPDRAEAIAEIIRGAAADDVIILAGKGHETTQEINGEFHHFSDVEVAAQCSTGNPACVPLPNTGRIACATFTVTNRNLPHWYQTGATYWTTFRLGDAIPQQKLAAWKEERAIWLQHHPQPWDDGQWEEYNQRFGERFERWLDAGAGECWLRRAELRAVVEKCLRHFDGQRYDLAAYVVMPNHVHALIAPRPGFVFGEIMRGLKGVSARECNILLGRTGQPFWQDESYDHIVRNERQFWHFWRYVEENPARLRAGEYSLYLAEGKDTGRIACATLGGAA